MLQRSNSDRDKNHRKSMLECTGNTSASIGEDNICSVKNKNPPQHTPPVFLRFKF